MHDTISDGLKIYKSTVQAPTELEKVFQFTEIHCMLLTSHWQLLSNLGHHHSHTIGICATALGAGKKQQRDIKGWI